MKKNLKFFPPPSKTGFVFAFLILFCIVSFAHLYRIDSIPQGFYWDETSIGYNAFKVSESGTDEFGHQHPIFFTAFGENKNPIYIYTAAAIFKLLGTSEFTLRFTSYVFFILSLIFTFILGYFLFPKNKPVLIYLLVTFGFLPQFFTLSRISFEAISQLTFVSASILFIFLSFNRERTKKAYGFALMGGVFLGLSVYTYSTARLLSLLTLGTLWVFYVKRDNLKKLVVFTFSVLVTLIPYFYYVIRYPNALTARLDDISYLYSDMGLLEKVWMYLNQYFSYWSLNFLILNGDTNLRHSVGFGGIIFLTTLILFLVGMFRLINKKKQLLNRFNLFLLSNLILAPSAAAFTDIQTPHLLRSLLLGYFMVLVSCYGLDYLFQINNSYKKMIRIGFILFFVIEIVLFQGYYFIVYASKSIPAMNSFGIKELFQQALDQNPKEVSLLDFKKEFYVTGNFYSIILKNHKNISLTRTETFISAPGLCYIFPLADSRDFIPSLPYVDLIFEYKQEPVEKLFVLNQPKSLYMGRCIKDLPK